MARWARIRAPALNYRGAENHAKKRNKNQAQSLICQFQIAFDYDVVDAIVFVSFSNMLLSERTPAH
jgi:hypothetical protein